MKSLLLSVLVFLSVEALAQNPVSWTYSAKKTGDKTYEVTLVATIQSGWHLYSQNQPADAINMPTTIEFKSNPLISFDGKVKEQGKMEVFKDKKLKISANQYSGKVTFVQKVKLKTNVKTNVVGTVEYQTCNDVKCLPPVKASFNVSLK